MTAQMIYYSSARTGIALEPDPELDYRVTITDSLSFDPIALDINPLPLPRMTRKDSFDPKPIVISYREYAGELRRAFKERGVTELPYSFCLFFVRSMPQSWSQKRKKKSAGTVHQSRPDLDNLVKGVLDALCGSKEKDDSRVAILLAAKFWGYKPNIFFRPLHLSSLDQALRLSEKEENSGRLDD